MAQRLPVVAASLAVEYRLLVRRLQQAAPGP